MGFIIINLTCKIFFCPGASFWKSTRKIRAISQEDYSSFKGKRKYQPAVSDSDSDFETPPHPRRPSFRESNEISPVVERIDQMETSLKASMGEIEKVQQLKTESDVSVLSTEVKRTESTLYSFKKALSCIVCKALATYVPMEGYTMLPHNYV